MTTSNKLNILGIAGLPRSGKDTVAELCMERGYFGVSFGDIFRDESRKRHADKSDPISVKHMTETSNYLRGKYGADYALQESLRRYEVAQKLKNYVGLVVFSVRAPIEVDFILEHGGDLVWIETLDEIRHKRALSHMREGEAEITLEEMKAQEALQEKPQPGIPAEVQMDIGYVREHATIVIKNNGNDVNVFLSQAEKALGLSDK